MNKKTPKNIVHEFLKKACARKDSKGNFLPIKESDTVDHYLLDNTVKFALRSFCYFCGESEVRDSHQLYPRSFSQNSDIDKLTLCPTHHAMIHRGVADIWFSKGKFYLYLRERRVVLPFYLNYLIIRSLGEEPLKFNYGNELRHANKLFRVDELNLTECNMIKQREKRSKLKGRTAW